jgi:DNA-binding NarL/FixJ family response regulator
MIQSPPGPADSTAGASPIRVAVFEPRPLVAEGIAALLAAAPGVDVVGATAHLDEAERMVTEASVQVVVFGAENQRPEQIRMLSERLQLAADSDGRTVGLVCIVPGGPAALDELSEADVPALVTTDVSLRGLRDAIETAYHGETNALPLETLRNRVTSSVGRPQAPAGTLTQREQEVLRALAAGYSTKEIAMHLGISVNTVRTHVQHLMPKLGVHSRLQAAAVAAVDRLVDAGPDDAEPGR